MRLAPCLGVLLAAFAPAAAVAPIPVPLREHVQVVARAWRRVGLTVTVVDRQGRPVTGLRRADFRLFDGAAATPIEDFGVEGARADRPLSVAVLLDLSQSMRAQITGVREAARALLSRLRPGDEIMVAKFNDQVTVLQPFTSEASDPERTLARLGPARGGTALFRAIEETLRDLRDRPGRKVILAVSDGLDNLVDRRDNVLQSLYLQDLQRLAFRSQTIVYGIRPGMASGSWLPFEGLVEATGGRLLYTGGDLERLFARLGTEFLEQYYVAYDIDPEAPAGRFRRVRVEVTRPDVVVKTMSGYAAPRTRAKRLLRDLLDDDSVVRSDAAWELGFVADDRAAAALRAALDDADDRVRAAAAFALGRLADEKAKPALVARLGDPAERVRAAASGALRLFGPRALPDLLAAAGPGSGSTAVLLASVAAVLGRAGDDRALPPLGTLLAHRDPDVRIAAADGLGALGLGEGVPPLRGALRDLETRVRAAALRAIIAIAGRAARAIVEEHLARETDPGVREQARVALDSLD